MALPVLIKLASMAGIAIASGYTGYQCGKKSGVGRFLDTADDYDGLVSDEELAADVEEELVDDEEDEDEVETEVVEEDETRGTMPLPRYKAAKKCR